MAGTQSRSHRALLSLIPLVALGGLFLALGLARPPAAPQAQEAPVAVAAVINPADYTPLSFDEVFVTPAGPKGLEYTDKIKSLEGKKVSMTGFMVKNYGPDPSVFLFSDVPRIHNEREEGLADSLPPSLLHVILQVRPGDAPAWRGEKMTLFGTLELGRREELSGRVSYVRLRCDHITDTRSGGPLEVRKPTVLQRNRLGS